MTFNPFENDEQKNSYIPQIEDDIVIWIEQRGRKSDTFISGLPLTKDQLLDHLKNIKKKKGCNGSVKEIIDDNGITKLVIHTQGNLKAFINEYFNTLGYTNIKLKG
jgi:translation initiation factor 1 (eIF-1/SUI1)